MNNATAALLNEIAENAEMGRLSVSSLLKVTRDGPMRAHLKRELASFEDAHRRACAMLTADGRKPEHARPITKLSARMGIRMQTARCRSPRKIAEMLIEGNHLGVTDLTEAIRDTHGAGPGAAALAQHLRDAEQQYASELNAFL